MITIICFIIPTLLFLITLPLKAVLLSLKAKEKIQSMQERGKHGKGSLLSRIENWADKDDGQLERAMWKGTKKTVETGKNVIVGSTKAVVKTAETTKDVAKFSYRTAKRAYKVARFTARAIIFAIKWAIRFIRFLIILIKSIVAFLVSLGVVGIVILVIIVIVIIGAIAVVVCMPDSLIVSQGSGGSGGGFSGYDYLSIDWSQDFSSKLSEIESTYGAKNRQHAELVILNLRTLQENKDFKLDPATWIGIKRVESITEVFKDSSQSVFKNYSTVEEKPNDWNCAGPYQINLKNSLHEWTLNNSKYTPEGTPPSYQSTRDDTYGNVYFYPDLCLGTNSAYTKELSAWVENSKGNRGYGGIAEDLKKCFSDLGVAYSDEKGKLVLEFMCANAYNEGHVHNLSENPHNTIVKLYIKFFETYGWKRNDAHVNLIKSCINATGKDGVVKDIFVEADPQTTWVWGENAGTVNNDMSVGVLDKDGKAVNKSLYGYLGANDSKIQSGMASFEKSNSSIMSARNYYGVACYFVGTWEIEKTIDYLGLREQLKKSSGASSGASDGSLMSIIDRECKAPEPNRIHYETATASADNAYVADCSRFIARVLTEAGYNPFGITSSNHEGFTAHDDFHACASEAASHGGGVSTGTEKPWVRANQPQAIIYEGGAGGQDMSKLEPGDVCYIGGGDSHHVVFYTGKNSSGVETIAHASHTGGTGCSMDLNDLSGGYSVGYSNFYCQGDVTFIFRPSLFK